MRVQEGTVFAEYRLQKALMRGTKPHPANVVESTAMASVEPPDVTYLHHLPAEVISEGRISGLQVEDVVYAGQATEFLLPDGSRKGHWNGDGTGIGKGREIYAFMYEQLQQGRLKHVHISASHQLCADAERDRDAVGVPLPIVHQAKFKPTDLIPADSGIFFTTYTMLSADFGGERPRFKQLIDWLGPDFDGVKRRACDSSLPQSTLGGLVGAIRPAFSRALCVAGCGRSFRRRMRMLLASGWSGRLRLEHRQIRSRVRAA